MLIRQWLSRRTLPRLEGVLLLTHVLECSREWLIAHDDTPLSATHLDRLQHLEQARLAGEPMAYLLGHREFWGHRFAVSPAVLIPRPETELLVQVGLDALADTKDPCVLDLGTGSGIIAISIALMCPQARVAAVDLSQEALSIAQDNARTLGAKVDFFCGSWFEALREPMRFHVILANPPYVASGDAHLQAGDLRFEPLSALTDGLDGLEAYRTIIAQAARWLEPGGKIWFEHGFDQARSVANLLESASFISIKTLQDLAGHPRVTGGSYNVST